MDAKHKVLKDYIQFSEDKVKTVLSVVKDLEKRMDCVRSKKHILKSVLSDYRDLKKMMDC